MFPGYKPILAASWSISYDTCHAPSHSRSSVSPDLLFLRTIFILEGLEWNIIMWHLAAKNLKSAFLVLKDSLKTVEAIFCF